MQPPPPLMLPRRYLRCLLFAAFDCRDDAERDAAYAAAACLCFDD